MNFVTGVFYYNLRDFCSSFSFSFAVAYFFFQSQFMEGGAELDGWWEWDGGALILRFKSKECGEVQGLGYQLI